MTKAGRGDEEERMGGSMFLNLHCVLMDCGRYLVMRSTWRQ